MRESKMKTQPNSLDFIARKTKVVVSDYREDEFLLQSFPSFKVVTEKIDCQTNHLLTKDWLALKIHFLSVSQLSAGTWWREWQW